jgi:ATP-dependent exoDNAse (exonuclease V) beta subunit
MKLMRNWSGHLIFNLAADSFIKNEILPVEDFSWPKESLVDKKIKIKDLNKFRSDILSASKKDLKMPFQTSYSDLAHGKDINDEHQSLLAYSKEQRKMISSETSLTPGNKTGDLLHNLFEFSDWAEVMSEDVDDLRGTWGETEEEIPDSKELKSLGFSRLLAQELRKAGLWTSNNKLLKERCIETTQIIKHTLECQIDEPTSEYDISEMGLAPTFRLGDLERVDIFPEMEFQFSFGENAELFEANDKGGGWVKGFMDLVFRRKGTDGEYRYYVLDWKSNALLKYTSLEIDNSMKDSHFDIQAKLYQLAMHEWLQELVGPSYHPAKYLGGAIYAYVRGNHEEPSKDSFLNIPLSMDEVTASRKEFISKLQSHKKFNSGVKS